MLVAVRSLAVVIIMVFSLNPLFAGDIPLSALSDLNNFAKQMVEKRSLSAGYPVNQNTELKEFYQWYINSGLAELAMNNVGNPRKPSPYQLSTHKYENEVVDFFAPLYGFNKNESWGIVTFSGTDGNNHGVYFGAKYLLAKTRMKPVVYVS
ncbi:MAG TPA: pyridoxal-dependent decarboxylase, partial [Syntrophus sp. (in: bacteria)]|nr:pyridoxal-dependent decarboxylase [Syntrophus sp. (in: bacteria)]